MLHELDEMQQLAALDGGDTDQDGLAPDEVEEETPMGVPFGWFGITLLINILQYMVLLGLSLVVLIIIRVFMPANMLP